MKQLMQMILALPLTKFQSFLRIKNNMKPNGLIYSILSFKAIEKEKPAKEILEFPDPLATALKNYNEEILSLWNSTSAASSDSSVEKAKISEDDHLEIVVTQFREFDRENFPDLAKLKIRIESLINTYTAIADGYSTYTLTTLLGAITFVSDEKKTSRLYGWYYKKTPKEFNLGNEEILEILNIYASLREPEEARLINLLYKIDLECQALNNILDIFIEEYIFTIIVVLQNNTSVEEMLESHTDFSDAIATREITGMLQTCILDKGKDAIDRLKLFYKIYDEIQSNIKLQGNETTEKGIIEFKKNLRLFFSESKLPKLTLFNSALPHQTIIPQTSSAITASLTVRPK